MHLIIFTSLSFLYRIMTQSQCHRSFGNNQDSQDIRQEMHPGHIWRLLVQVKNRMWQCTWTLMFLKRKTISQVRFLKIIICFSSHYIGIPAMCGGNIATHFKSLDLIRSNMRWWSSVTLLNIAGTASNLRNKNAENLSNEY